MKIAVWALILCIMAYSVSAMGLARPYFPDNTIEMEANETMEITFQLQNLDPVENRMIVKMISQHTMEIDGGPDYENQFTLDPGEIRDVAVEFYAEDEGLYRVDYSYSDICPSGSGICMNAEVGNSFFIQVGNDNRYWAFNIPLDYAGYSLNTEARSIEAVDDLLITTDDGLITVDFSGQTIDLTGFQEQNVEFAQRKIVADFSGFSNKQAIITMYQIESNYKIKKDGEECSSSVCKILSYSNKRLRFEVPGFSSYEVVYVQNTSGGSGGSSGSSGSSSGGTIIRTNNTNRTQNITPPTPVPEPEPEPEPEPKPEPEPVKQQTKVNTSSQINRPSPFVNTLANKTQEVDTGEATLSSEGKSLLMRSVLLGIGALFLGGLLFYYIRKDETGA